MKIFLLVVLSTFTVSANAEPATLWGCDTSRNVYGTRNANLEVRNEMKYQKANSKGELDLVKCTFIFSDEGRSQRLQVWFNGKDPNFSELLTHYTKAAYSLPTNGATSDELDEMISYSVSVEAGGDSTFEYKLSN